MCLKWPSQLSTVGGLATFMDGEHYFTPSHSWEVHPHPRHPEERPVPRRWDRKAQPAPICHRLFPGYRNGNCYCFSHKPWAYYVRGTAPCAEERVPTSLWLMSWWGRRTANGAPGGVSGVMGRVEEGRAGEAPRKHLTQCNWGCCAHT